MANLEGLGRLIETDVLVIGGGVTGLWAANSARAFTDNVLVVDKGPKDLGGLAWRAGGDVVAVLPEERVDDYLEELVYYYDGLCEQDLVEKILEQSYDRFLDYERLGHRFVRRQDGALISIPQRGLEHMKCHLYRPFGMGGRHMIKVLLDEADRVGAKRLGRILVTDLLKKDDRLIGAIGFNTINGDFHIFKSRAVILAAGAHGRASALRAGAELKNCEFATIRVRPKKFAWEGLTSLLPLGATFVNAGGEHFMEKYCPSMKSNTAYSYIALGMAIEEREGRGPFFLDCSAMKPEDIVLMMPEAGWVEINNKKLLELGIHFFEDRVEWVTEFRAGAPGGGGVVADLDGCTNVPGLFVAGTTWATYPGVYMGGWNLCRTAVTGHIAGDSAGKYAQSHPPLQIEGGEVEALKNCLYSPLGKTGGISSKDAVKKMQETMTRHDVFLLKNETGLKKALGVIDTLKNDLLPQIGAADAHELMKRIETRDMILTTEMFLRASLMRTESRAGFYREDHPHRDDKNWLQWIIVTQRNGELGLRAEPLPFHEYSFKPTRYYFDHFQFPK